MNWLVNVIAAAGLPTPEATQRLAAGRPPAEQWDALARTAGLAPEALAALVARSFRLEPAAVDDADRRALRLVPEALARRHRVFVLGEDDTRVLLATFDPTDLDAEQAIGFATGRRVVFRVAPPRAILDAIDAAYSPVAAVASIVSAMDADVEDVVRVVEELGPESVSLNDAGAAPVVKLTNMILRDAVLERASDVHIEPSGRTGKVRFRVDGVLHDRMQLPLPALTRIVSRVKVLGKLDIADRLRPQDGSTQIVVEGRRFDLRISTVPTRESEKAVIRLLASEGARRLDEVLPDGPELRRFRHLLSSREGIIAVTGPTGSGKTTTLYAAVRELATGAVNVTTVEDPVEYELPGITQVQVEPKRGVTFASALRAVLRQDPDVILVGEVRDQETSTVAVQASMTGHLVLATLHTNDAVGAIARLRDLGVDRASLASALRGAVAQRLMRRLCPHCARPAADPLTPDEARLTTAYGVRPTARAIGCTECGHTGYRGRVAIMEVVVNSAALAEQVATGASGQALLRTAQADGTRTLRDVSIDRVRAGDTTLQEVERVLGDIALPAAGADAAPASASPASAAAPAPSTPRILIVDDDDVARALACELLVQEGYRVHEAEHGIAALDAIAAAPFDLVLTDLHMPVLDGRGLVRQLRAGAGTTHLPVIVLTSSDDPTEETALIDAGADDYVRKPFDPPRLRARVRGVLRRNGL